MASSKKKLPPVHPGEALQEIMNEAGLSANALALALRVPGNRITAILHRQRGITADDFVPDLIHEMRSRPIVRKKWSLMAPFSNLSTT